MKQQPLTLNDYSILPCISATDFPLAENFAIEITFDESSNELHMAWVDRTLGIFVDFPWWGQAELRLEDRRLTEIPIGSATDPFSDEEQCWHILIWENAGHVFIAAGEGEAFDVWFRVPLSRYRDAWRQVLHTP